MRTREDIEAYLIRSGHPHKEVAQNTWLVSDPSDAADQIVVRVTEGLVIFRLTVLEMKKVRNEVRERFFETLLRLNADDMVHGAYGIADDDLFMIATLRIEHLDYEEFAGTLDDFSIALTNHYPQLRDLVAEGS